MDNSVREKLEVEQAIGEQYQRAYEGLVSPFIERKKAELFEAFQILPTTEPDKLMAIKLQCNALESLDDEFRHYITTGQLAQRSLTEKEKTNG